jgi:hypothetical protein
MTLVCVFLFVLINCIYPLPAVCVYISFGSFEDIRCSIFLYKHICIYILYRYKNLNIPAVKALL